MKRPFSNSAAAALLLLAAPAQADVAITYSNPAGQGEDMVLVVSGNRAAMQIPAGQGQDGRILYDKESNKMFMVVDSDRTYMDMDAMMQTLGGLSDMMAGMMDNMPDDVKSQLGGLFGNSGADLPKPQSAELVATGQSDSVNGISCSISTYRSADAEIEMCLADPSAVGVSAADFSVLKAMMAKQKEAAKQAGDMLGMKGMDMGPGAIDQVPLRIRQLSGQDAGSSSEFRGISQDVDASAVSIPSDYQPMSLN